MTVSSPAGDWIKVWIEGQRAAVEKWLDVQKAPAADQTGAFAGLLQQLAGFGQPPGLGDFGKQIGALWRSFSPAPSVNEGLPSLGPFQEEQEALQDLANALADYQRLAADMVRILAKVHNDTLDLVNRRSSEQANSGQPIDSFKVLYDLWIECGETTYAKVAESDAYCRLQADFCNAGIRVQSRQQTLLERWLKQLDLPTRSELNTLHQRVRDLKKQLETFAVARDDSAKNASGRKTKPRASARSGQGTAVRPRTSRKKS